MKSKTLLLIAFLASFFLNAQVGIGTQTPHPSSILHLESNNKGLLIPKIHIQSQTDTSQISNPVNGLMIYNTNNNIIGKKGLYYWSVNRWVFFFSPENLNNLLGVSKNNAFIGSTPVTINNFLGEEIYEIGENVSNGWTVINDASGNITIDRANNSSVITFSGMLQANNSSSVSFSVGFGIFVNDLLVSTKVMTVNSAQGCAYREFTINGLVNSLPVGSHNIKVAVKNRSRLVGSGYNVTYGGAASGCNSINSFEARLSATVFINQPIIF